MTSIRQRRTARRRHASLGDPAGRTARPHADHHSDPRRGCGDDAAACSGWFDRCWVVDVPYFLGVRPEESVTDYYLELNGEKPRFREDWDLFSSIPEYEEFCSEWIDELMRSLDDRGSMFIHGVHTNIHLIGRLLQVKGIQTNNDIAWIKRNSRPNICQTRLQHSNETVIWAVKNPEACRFNYRRCRMHHDPRDYFSERGRQMRDVWDIVTRPGVGHPSPKPIELYMRMLDVAGRPGGTLLELFCGAGPGAIAAMRWVCSRFPSTATQDICRCWLSEFATSGGKRFLNSHLQPTNRLS